MRPYLLSFATGQSDPRGHRLSPQQNAFLDLMPAPEENKLRRNFPWREESPPWRDTPLVPASFYNFRQYCLAQGDAFPKQHRPDLEAWLARAEHHLVFAGSCGLELLRRLEPSPAMWRRIHVFAFGPVVHRLPPCRVFTVQGKKDWISQLYLGRPDARVASNHLDYLEDPEVAHLARRFVATFRPA